MASRTLALFASAALASCVVGCGQKPPPPAVPATVPATSPAVAGRDLHCQLDRRVPELILEAQPLADAIEFICSVGHPPDVRWDQLKEVGVTPQTPVTVRLHNVKVTKALQVVLDAATPVGGPAKLGFNVDDERGKVVISTADDCVVSSTVVRAYDVRAVLTPLIDVRPAAAPATGPGRGHDRARPRAVADLITLIEESVDPDSWASAGGRHAEIAEAGGVLTIKQTKANHRQIADVIAALHDQVARSGR